MIETLLACSLLGFAGAAALSDVRTRRIPNRLLLVGLLAALILRALQGMPEAMHGVTGAAIAFVVALPFFAVKAIGGGDAKMMIMVGAFVGQSLLLPTLAMTALAGGAIALTMLVRRGALAGVLANMVSIVGYGLTLGRHRNRPVASSAAPTVPYGLAIAIGAVAAFLL